MISKLVNSIGSFLVSNNWFTVKLIKYKNSSIRVVYYHMVTNNHRNHYFKNKAISKDLFQKQINFFKKNYTIVTIEKAVELINNNQTTKNILVISFDDGFKENFTVIYPILEKNNIKGIFFMISNCLDNKDLMWRNKLLLIDKNRKSIILNGVKKLVEEFGISNFEQNDNLLNWSLHNWNMDLKEDLVNFLWNETMPFSLKEYLEKEVPYMKSEEIKILSQNGHEIGSHSKSHPVFSNLHYQDFKEEILSSSKIISTIIEKRVTKFSYPFGRVSSVEFEKKYNTETEYPLQFFGTKNNLKNTDFNRRWERDNTEHNYNVMLFRFAILPIFRNIKNT